jgi:hypothetical protein
MTLQNVVRYLKSVNKQKHKAAVPQGLQMQNTFVLDPYK